MKNIRLTNLNTHRDAWVEVNLEHLANNIKVFKSNFSHDKKVLAVVKADAYGHGAAMLAPTILACGVDMLGVASIDEALDLRQAKINSEILVLGAIPLWAFESAVENNITVSIFSPQHLEACKIAHERCGKPVKAHVKLDTGMNRIGVRCNEAKEYINSAIEAEYVDLRGIFTHLCCAENEEITSMQLKIWDEIISQVKTDSLLLHVLNTAGSISYEVESNMVRLGIGIYGLMPDLSKECAFSNKLKQIISLKGRITNIHEIKCGEGVSYGHTFVAKCDTKVATIPLGYADGVPRALSNKIFGKLHNKQIQQIGNITMDQMMFDITDIDAKLGDVITILDDNTLSIDEWAKILNTINYELTCRLKVRLPRVYTR